MKRRDWMQITFSSLALAAVVAFNNCSGINSPTGTSQANAVVISLPPLPEGGSENEQAPPVDASAASKATSATIVDDSTGR